MPSPSISEALEELKDLEPEEIWKEIRAKIEKDQEA